MNNVAKLKQWLDSKGFLMETSPPLVRKLSSHIEGKTYHRYQWGREEWIMKANIACHSYVNTKKERVCRMIKHCSTNLIKIIEN